MKYIKENISKDELLKVNEALVAFNRFLMSQPETKENIGIYEHWLDCMDDIQNIIITENSCDLENNNVAIEL